MSYLDPPYGSVPPPPSAPPASPSRGRTVGAVVVLAVLVAVGGIGVLVSGAGKSGDATGADTTRQVHASGSVDQARIDEIVADAHSGRYFSNDHAGSYPAVFETGFVKGGLQSRPDMSNRAAACILSYVETKWTFTALMDHTDQVKQIGADAGLHCVKYV
jgi:hypothetical protein